MKSLITLLIATTTLFASTDVWAAKCKYRWDTINYRTGEKVRWTGWTMNRMVIMPNTPLMSAIVEGDKMFLGLQVASSGKGASSTRPTKQDIDTAMLIPEGAKLSLLMEDESIYDLFAERDVVGDTGMHVKARDKYTFWSTAIVRFPLDAAAMAALSAQKVKDLRLHTPERNYDFSFGKKPSDKLQRALACIP